MFAPVMIVYTSGCRKHMFKGDWKAKATKIDVFFQV